MTRWPSMSISTVAYEWPFCLAKSSTPSTVTGPGLRVGQPPDQPDQGEPGHDHAQRPGQPGTRAAGQRQRDPLQQAPQPRGATLIPARQPGSLLGERGYRARRVAAAKPAGLQHDLHRPPAAGKILQAAPVPVMHPGGDHPAAPASQRGCPGPGRDLHRITQILDLIDIQACQVREQQAQQAGFPHGKLVQHN